MTTASQTRLEIKEIPEMSVLSKTIRARLRTIVQDIGSIADEMMTHCEKTKLPVAGPMVFVYRGADGSPDQEFELEITQPLEVDRGDAGPYTIKRLEGLRCVERRFLGSFADIATRGYEPLMKDMEQAGIDFGDQCREVYTNWVGIDSPDNVTEIQMGVKG